MVSAQIVTPAETTPTDVIITKQQTKAVYFVLGLFTLSMGGSIVGLGSSSLGALLFVGWYLAALSSIVMVLGWFFEGIIHYRRDNGQTLRFSLIFFVCIFIVGYGTCAVNLGALQGL